MLRPSSLLPVCLLLQQLLLRQSVAGITVELSEVLPVRDDAATGEYETTLPESVTGSPAFEEYGGVDPIDADCPAAGKCIGLLTRDGSLELDSRYGCTEPFAVDASSRAASDTCAVYYVLSASSDEMSTIASVKVAFHPDSISKLMIEINGRRAPEIAVEEWEAIPGSTELQEIPGLEGLEAADFKLIGVMEEGEYFAILEVEIYVTVDEVLVVGTSASTRTSISATATADASSVMNTLDGDATDASSWTCLDGEVCEITYDLQATESLEQLRIAFSGNSDAGGQLNVLAAGESGIFSTVRTGIEAGGRPLGSDGLQTFGGMRALARYVKIEAVPTSGGSIVINEVEFRVGDVAPVRPVAEKPYLKPTGPLPRGADGGSSFDPNYDLRTPSDGGCDSPTHIEGCHVYYMKDGDMDSRWTCGPLAIGSTTDCDTNFSLNHYRYIRQIQIAFHLGDEQLNEFSIEAETAQGWMTVVASAITSGDTTDYQTFDVGVHAVTLKLIPEFQRFNQWFSVKEMVILERRKNDFIAGTLPVFEVDERFENDVDDEDSSDVEIPTRFEFDIPSTDDSIRFSVAQSTVTALRMRFPADREFVFDVLYSRPVTSVDDEDVLQRFASAGGENTWETFTLSEPAVMAWRLEIIAVSGPTFDNKPKYPALRVVDFQVVGEPFDNGPGFFKMVTTTMTEWRVTPDLIGDGVSDQEEIMTAICETKGATYDGTDCVGELNDTPVYISLNRGEFFLDGPVFIKSGVTLEGGFSDDYPTWTSFVLYEGANNGNTAEDAVMVIDGVTDATVDTIRFERKAKATDDIVPGTVGNLCVDVRNSQELAFQMISPRGCRSGAAHFTDSSNITASTFWDGTFDTGNYAELTRVDNFRFVGFPDVGGVLIDTCNNIVWEGRDTGETPGSRLDPPSGGSQTASVVITGESSGIVFRDSEVGPGAEPIFLMESTMPLTLENLEFEEAVSGDCIVEVPEGSSEDLVVQVNVFEEQTLSKSGDCWLLD